MLVCLAFVICALVEFAIAIILHRRKEWKNVSDLEKNAKCKKTAKTCAAKTQVNNRFMAELRTNVSISPSTNAIDFMAIWIYLALFFLFNCIYWNGY